MRFGRVEGVVAPVGQGEQTRLRLTVYLETGADLRVVREEELAPVRPILGWDDLAWHADQWTQETVGVDLAAEGWEVIGGGELPPPDPGQLPRSAAYAVRNIGGPP